MRIVIVGASLAGFKTASALRAFGSQDDILVVGEENMLPYDRPPLSKSVLIDRDTDFDTLLLTDPDGAPDVDYLLGERAVALDLESRSVSLARGDSLDYDVLVIATGAAARRLPWPEVAGVCYLRTFDDAVELRKQLESSRRVVVVGGGFIGAEAAAAARQHGLEVTILEASAAPLSRVLGAEVGNALGRLHTRRGVDLKCGAMVTGVEGDGRVTGVHLATGEVVPADTVVIGVGAAPVTSWLESSGLLIDDGVVCDEHCRAEGTTNVYAVGDVCRWVNPFYGESMRVEHWTNAVEQAAAVAQTILGDPQPYEHIPYVWSHQYEHQIQMVGQILPGHQPTFVGAAGEGDPFVALYRDGDLLTGAVCLDQARAVPRLRRVIAGHGSLEHGLGATSF